MSFPYLCVIASALCVLPCWGQQTLTLPIGSESFEGWSQEHQLLNARGVHRTHWFYEIPTSVAAGAIEITRIDLRPDGSETHLPSVIPPQLELALGLLRMEGREASYAEDLAYGWDAGSPRPFFSGPLSLPTGSISGSPRPWSASIPGSAFRFDPRDGRFLVLEWRVRSPIPQPWAALDAANPTGYLDGIVSNTFDATANHANYTTRYLVPVVRLHYRPATRIHAAMRSSTRYLVNNALLGNSIRFEDLSSTPVPGGITTWAWDFDSDGVVDSNAQHPTYTYARCGEYDVTLTVADALGADTVVRRGFVRVGTLQAFPPRARFYVQYDYGVNGCPRTLFFNDLSDSTPTSWEWDFDADGVIDSTQRNPTITISSNGPRRTRLRVSNACGSSATERESFDACNSMDECDRGPWVLSQSSFSNISATDSVQPSACFVASSDVWYGYSAQVHGEVHTANVCALSGPTGFRPQLQIYTGSCADPVLLACGEGLCGSREIEFMGYVGQSYYLRVSDPQGLQGTFRVSIGPRSVGATGICRPFPACAGMRMSVQGGARIGSSLALTIPAGGLPSVLWMGREIMPIALCAGPCMLTVLPEVVFAGPQLTLAVPNQPSFLGLRAYLQGAVFGSSSGCVNGFSSPFATTDTLQIDVR